MYLYCPLILTTGALNCIIKKRLYRGRLSYLPAEGSADSNPSNESTNNEPIEQSKTGETSQMKQKDDPTKNSTDDVQCHDSIIETDEGTTRELSNPVDQQDGVEENKEQNATNQDDTTRDSTIEDIATDTEAVISKSDEVAEEQGGPEQSNPSPEIQAQSHNHPYGPKPNLLSVSLSEPVPSNWETLETEFIGIVPTMVPCMAHGFYGDPSLPIGSGNIRILVLENALTRMGLFGMLTGAESGKHIGMDGLQVIDVKAYRLEPLTAPGMLTLDGEQIFYGPHQVQVHPGLARIMCRIKQKS